MYLPDGMENTNMMAPDGFVMRTPVAESGDMFSARDDDVNRSSRDSFGLASESGSFINRSFMSRSMHCENFGDFGSFNDSNKDNETCEVEFEEEKEDYFAVKDHKTIPKLPCSKKEVRKTNSIVRPEVIIETGHEGEADFLVSPMKFKSPKVASMLNRLRAEPVRGNLKRSVSDVGSLSSKSASLKEVVPSTPNSFRDLWHSQKGEGMSQSFRHFRETSFRNNLNSYQELEEEIPLQPQLDLFEEQQQEKELQLEPQLDLFADQQQQEEEEEVQLRSQQSSDEGTIEGEMPLKPESPVASKKKRTLSRERLNKVISRSKDSIGKHSHRLPTRKNSWGSKKSHESNGSKKSIGRNSRSRQPSISDHGKSNHSNSRRRSRPRKDGPSQSSSSTDGTSNDSRDQKKESLLSDVRRRARSRRSRSRRNLTKESPEQVCRELSEERNKFRELSQERNKFASTCNNRRAGGRRLSMTGGIVDAEEPVPRKTQRRSTMEFKIKHSPRQKKPRSFSMDNLKNNMPSSPSSATLSPDQQIPKTSGSRRGSSKRNLTSYDENGNVEYLFSPQAPFAGDFMETTPKISNATARTPSRKASTGSRGRDGPRRTKSGEISKEVKGRHQRSNSEKRKVARNRSDVGRQRMRALNASQHQKKQIEDKSVTVAEILALVAAPAEISGEANSKPKSTNLDGTETTFSNSTGGRYDSRDRSRGRSADKARRDRSRTDSRSTSRDKNKSGGLYKLRKGKRVGHQPDDPNPEAQTPKKKGKRSVGKVKSGGKESRLRGHFRGLRRSSAI